MEITNRLKEAFNVFRNKNITDEVDGVGISSQPVISYHGRADRPKLHIGGERTIISSIYNRIALDVSSMNVNHVVLDDSKRYLKTVDSKLNKCLTSDANIDQSGRSFIHDVVMSMFDEGHVAIVAVDKEIDDYTNALIDVESIRTGKILEWYPRHVKVLTYNDNKGIKEPLILHKKNVCIIENPFFAVMNERNSTMRRLIHKLNLLDSIDEQSGSGKLDLIIQLPYQVKTPAKKEMADQRRRDIEMQLTDTKYGIAYTDGTEKVTQLNRSVENNLMGQIEYLTNLLFSQLCITQGVLDGTADEKTMTNYTNRVVEPIISAITMEISRRFLSEEAKENGESINFFMDPFRLVTVTTFAEIADKLTRNEIATSNEVRQVIGMKPSKDPKADELRNSNLSAPSSVGLKQEEIQNEEKDTGF